MTREIHIGRAVDAKASLRGQKQGATGSETEHFSTDFFE